MPRLRLIILAPLLFATGAVATASDESLRTLVVRERATATLLDDSFAFRVMKLRGYSIDVMIHGEKRTLKLGDRFEPTTDSCVVIFEEISPETRIARFKTDCR